LQAIQGQKVWLWLLRRIVYFLLMIYSLVLVKIYPNEFDILFSEYLDLKIESDFSNHTYTTG
jgi:hypothetical protein